MVMPNMALFGSCFIVVPLRMVQIIQASVCPASGGQTCYGVVEELDTVALPRSLNIGLAYVVVDKMVHNPYSIANFEHLLETKDVVVIFACNIRCCRRKHRG
jgi:hypothetical protein